MVELAVSLTVLLILTALAIPSFTRSFRAYQMNDAAARFSDVLKFTRFEAVRQNRPVNFLIKTSGTGWLVGTDSNHNSSIDATDKQALISGTVTLLPSGAPPSTSSILAKLGTTASLDDTKSGAVGSLQFDARGAVTPLGAHIFYLGSATDPEFGYRAVVLLPSGATQIWTAPAGGPWQRVG